MRKFMKVPILLLTALYIVCYHVSFADNFKNIFLAEQMGPLMLDTSQISNVSPGQNSINVPRSANINVTFSQSINASTINCSNIKVFGTLTGNLAASFSYINETRTAVIDPDNHFKAGEEISVVLNSGIKTSSGDSISPFSYRFTVAATQGTAIFSESLLIQDSTLQIIASGDIDGDGDIDIVASFDKLVYPGIHYKAIDVYKRQANGNYDRTQRFFEQTPNPENTVTYLDLYDMDNDGFLDVTGATDGLGSFILIAYNDGSGNFGNIQTLICDVINFKPYLIADFDNDGDLDIMTNGFFQNSVAIYSNIGNHQFSAVNLNLNQYSDLDFITCNDFDNDGDVDAINRTKILLNNGDFSFSRLENSIPPGFSGVMKDFDNDGDLDAMGTGSPIYMHLNNGYGIFSDSSVVASPNYLFMNIAEDFNADGSLDLLLKDQLQNKFAVFKNNGTGNFTFLSSVDNSVFVPLFSNDMDSDGDIDILGKQQYRLYALLNSPDAFQTAAVDSVTPNQNAINVNKSSDIAAVFNQNMNASTINNSSIKVFGFHTGKLSASISYNSGTKTATINPNSDFKIGEKIQVTLSSGIKTSDNIPIVPFTWTFTVQALSGTGYFTEASIIDTSITEGELTTTVSGDFDSDGDLDLAASGYNIMIYKNNGTAGLTYSQGIAGYGGYLVAGDFDGDGDLDIVSHSSGINLFKNNGNGVFNFTSTTSGGGAPGDIGDLDEDGDLDIALWSGNSIKWYLNDGNGNFSERSITFTDISELPPFVLNLNVGDMDNDGDLDFTTVVIQIHTPQYTDFKTLYNDGNANFGNAVNLNAYFTYSNAIDLDIDNDLDVLSNNSIFLNNGTGIFTQSAFSSGTHTCILPADFDADGDIDAVFTNDGANNVRLFKNNSTGSMNFLANSTCGNNPNQGTSGDFDNDGDIDLVIVNGQGHGRNISDISIMKNNNNCTPPPCGISGSDIVLPGSSNNIFIGSTTAGYWDIANYDNTQATIQQSAGDTVRVNAGLYGGHFVLYFITPDGCGGFPFCSKHVYVEDSTAITCNITAIIEGFYNVSLNKLSIKDTVKAYLRNASSPFAVVDSSGSIIDSINFKCAFSFRNAPSGTYYIVLKHRNGLETWSKPGGTSMPRGGAVNYNFTTSASQSYGDNLKLVGSKYCIFSGDINRDEVVDLTDIGNIYNDSKLFASRYLPTDLTGDGFTDLSDISIAFNNSSAFVQVKNPLTVARAGFKTED